MRGGEQMGPFQGHLPVPTLRCGFMPVQSTLLSLVYSLLYKGLGLVRIGDPDMIKSEAEGTEN